MSKYQLNCLKFLFLGLSVFMIYWVVKTSLESNLFTILPELSTYPWFTTTIIDFYFNIVIIAAWVFYREQSKALALAWVISFVLLGSISTAFYVFLQLCSIKQGDSLKDMLIKKELA